MKVAVMGKDRRFACLEALLCEKGHDTVPPDEASLIITSWPPIASLPTGAQIAACGPEKAPDNAFDLLLDEKYLREIAYMTAEGALAASMAASEQSVCGVKCLVIGWGRIGRALTELLACMGAHVTVLTRRVRASTEIAMAGAYAAPTENVAREIANKRIIFSTPPALILDRSVLEMAEKDVIVIDLASPPYGVDIDAARDIGLRAWREPGLPGRYCPENAANAIYDSLVRGCVLHD